MPRSKARPCAVARNAPQQGCPVQSPLVTLVHSRVTWRMIFGGIALSANRVFITADAGYMAGSSRSFCSTRGKAALLPLG
ncbi:hypothetical protein D3C84_722160 [compost metagenome]